MIPLTLRDVEHGVRRALGASRARQQMDRDERQPSIASDFENTCNDLPLAAVSFALSLSSSFRAASIRRMGQIATSFAATPKEITHRRGVGLAAWGGNFTEGSGSSETPLSSGWVAER